MALSYRLLDELRNEDRLRDWLLDEMQRHRLDLTLLDTIVEQGAARGGIKSLKTEVKRHAFFDRFYGEIEVVRHEAAVDEWTEPFQEHPRRDLKSVLVFFAIEETARSLLFELNYQGKRQLL